MSSTRSIVGRPRGRRSRLLALASATALGVAGLVALAGPAHAVTVPTVVASVPVGADPFSVAVSPDGTRTYVANLAGASVSVVDTATNTQIATVATGQFCDGVAVSPDGTHVYAAYQSGGVGQLAVISTVTNTVTATVTTGAQASAVAVSPDGTRVYAMASEDLSSGTPDNGVVVVSTAANTVVGFYRDDNLAFDGSADGGLAVSPDGAKVYVTDTSVGSVDVFSTSTGTMTATIPDSGGPEGIALSPTGATAYVANLFASTVSVISTATNTVTATIGGLPSNPFGVAVTPDGMSVYVNGFGGLAVIDPVGNTLVATLASVTGGGIAVNPAGTRAYATNSNANTLMVLSAAVAPAVTAISPGSGDVTGGTSVTITGTGFTGATAVHFGTAAATSFMVNSDTQITATAPAEAAGTVDVTVTTPVGTSATSTADQYTYAAADLAVTMTADGDPGLLLAHIYYTITITNNGPSPLSSATITAPLPTPMTATSPDCTVGSGPTVTCTIGTLAAGAHATRHFTVPIGLLTLNHAYTVTATRTASTPVDTNPADDSATRTCTILTALILSCH